MTNTILYANPYSLDHTGFHFDSLEGFTQGMAALNKLGCEEVELDYTDGPDYALFRAAVVSQANITEWFNLPDDSSYKDSPVTE